jgi:hypothetical protein
MSFPMRSSRRFIVSALSIVSLVDSQWGSVKAFAITIQQAKQLVNVALKERGAAKLPGLAAVSMENFHNNGFYLFEVTWNNLQPGSAIVGHFAVDLKTGDVWDAVVCSSISSPELTKLQGQIRRRMGMTKEVYRKLKKPGPMC